MKFSEFEEKMTSSIYNYEIVDRHVDKVYSAFDGDVEWVCASDVLPVCQMLNDGMALNTIKEVAAKYSTNLVAIPRGIASNDIVKCSEFPELIYSVEWIDIYNFDECCKMFVKIKDREDSRKAFVRVSLIWACTQCPIIEAYEYMLDIPFQYITSPKNFYKELSKFWKSYFQFNKTEIKDFLDMNIPKWNVRMNVFTNDHYGNHHKDPVVARWVMRNHKSAFIYKEHKVYGPCGEVEYRSRKHELSRIKREDLTNGFKTAPKRAFKEMYARRLQEKLDKYGNNSFGKIPMELPGGFVQLDTISRLVEEGNTMNHCVGEEDYIEASIVEDCYILHYGDSAPKGITVEIVNEDGKLSMGDMFHADNIEVSDETKHKVKEALKL